MYTEIVKIIEGGMIGDKEKGIAKECPDYEIKKPETVKGENSSTISVTYKW